MRGNIVLEGLRHAWVTLEPLGLPMAVMGGIAMAAWEHVRATRDVDLMIGIGESGGETLLTPLNRAGFRPKQSPPMMTLGGLRLIQLLYQAPGMFIDLQVDLLLANSEYHRLALARRVPTSLAGLDVQVSVLTCEDLIVHKLLAGRIVDRADCVALLTANRDRLDHRFISDWSNRMGLVAEWSAVWEAAFPGEPLRG